MTAHSDTVAAAEPGLVLVGQNLDPTERLFDALPDALGDGIAAMPRRAPADRGTAAADVLPHARRHPHRAQLIDGVLRVVGLVRAERDRLWPVGARLNPVQCRHPFGMPVGECQAGVDQKAMAVLHQLMPHKAELCFLAASLA